jgi:hypothetical protein
MMIGIAQGSANLNTFVGGENISYGFNASNGGKYNNGGLTAFSTAYSPGDVIMIAIDGTAGKMWFGKNGTWLGSGDPATGANAAFTIATNTAFFPTASILEGATGQTWIGRFKSADFGYTPPSGFSPWE